MYNIFKSDILFIYIKPSEWVRSIIRSGEFSIPKPSSYYVGGKMAFEDYKWREYCTLPEAIQRLIVRNKEIYPREFEYLESILISCGSETNRYESCLDMRFFDEYSK